MDSSAFPDPAAAASRGRRSDAKPWSLHMAAVPSRLQLRTFPNPARLAQVTSISLGSLANYATVPAAVSLSSNAGQIVSPTLASAVNGIPVGPVTFDLSRLTPNSKLIAGFGTTASWLFFFTPPADVTTLWFDLYLNAAVITDETGYVRILAFV
ncbi:hypothetical protein DBR42_25050 [Pelomonas sp. HMWF004]|nr:hypothetical protein DBR42_25050 [Pelomonas sp. HMWF004]